MVLHLSPLALPALLALAQGLPVELAVADGLRVQRAREAQLAARWVDASRDARQAALERLQRLRRERPLPITTSGDRARAQGEAWRLLQGLPEADARSARLAAMVDALDLRVVPGVFTARESGLGEAMTVHVRALYPVELDLPVQLHLWWRSLEDGSEDRARSEPVPIGAFTRAGFEMYVRPPRSGPGRFALVPEIEHGRVRVRGFATGVDCASALQARATALRDRAAAGDLRAMALVHELAPRLQHGVRTLEALSAEEALAIGLSEPTESPLRLVEVPGLPGAPLLWSRAGVDAPGVRVLLLATAAGEHPSEFLCGALGRAWEELARVSGARLLVGDLPALAEEGPDLLALFRALRREEGVEELWLVLRGEAATLLPPRLRASGETSLAQRLMLCASTACRRAPRLGLSLPTLSIDALAEEEEIERSDSPSEPWLWLRRPDPDFALEAELPLFFREWIEGRLSAAPEDGPPPR